MNPHRLHQAAALVEALPVFLFPEPAGLLRWRAVLSLPAGVAPYAPRITAAGITRAHAERRCRRAALTELLRGWW